MSESQRNDYMDQVMAQQQKVEVDLKAKRAYSPRAAMNAPASPVVPTPQGAGPVLAERDRGGRFVTVHDPVPSNAVDVRITGWFRWKTVIVPPNAYVVHTRRGRTEPVNIGLGVSFRYNPYADSFLVVPGTMQTILINAHCICSERQGILVQGYVQWIVQDFPTAYKKLDFSDAEDPMRVVNVQLREQAEAAIKDKVATMSIDDVLSDKQPIIEELTARLRHVAEGEGGSDKGLGLRIVTVQIKEAVVSSPRVWENLQKPFRADRARIARLAELEAESVVQARELAHEKESETTRLKTEEDLAALRGKNEAAMFDREAMEQSRRQTVEQANARKLADEQHETRLRALALEQARLQKEAELAKAKLAEEAAQKKMANDAQIALEDARRAALNRQAEKEVELMAERQKIQNSVTTGATHARLIDALPVVAEKMPKPNELKQINVGGDGALATVIAQVLGAVDALKNGKEPGESPGGARTRGQEPPAPRAKT